MNMKLTFIQVQQVAIIIVVAESEQLQAHKRALQIN